MCRGKILWYGFCNSEEEEKKKEEESKKILSGKKEGKRKEGRMNG